jgi:hypothetical protein
MDMHRRIFLCEIDTLRSCDECIDVRDHPANTVQLNRTHAITTLVLLDSPVCLVFPEDSRRRVGGIELEKCAACPSSPTTGGEETFGEPLCCGIAWKPAEVEASESSRKSFSQSL